VQPSSSKGFIQVSPHDSRYFQFTNGDYFPALGYNMNYREIDWINPSNNLSDFQIMKDNGIQLARTWISQWSIYGAAWSPWRSRNPLHQSQEPDPRIRHNQYPIEGSTFESKFGPIGDSQHQLYLWLSHNETEYAGGNQWNYNPCMVYGWETPSIPVKPNTAYQISVTYKQQGIGSSRTHPQDPRGFAIKTGNWIGVTTEASSQTRTCENLGTGTVIARASSVADQINQWQTLTGAINTTASQNFLDFLYLSLENVTSGNVFVSDVSIRELVNGAPSGPNLFPKPSSDYHTYIDQRNSFALDQILDQARNFDIYLKLVITEKKDHALNAFSDGGLLANTAPQSQNPPLIYGRNQDMTASRWLQRAWWRYLQARWGYSPNIHSWELLNEGPDNNSTGHWDLTEEFAEYIKCGVFGQDDISITSNFKCSLNHPNSHLVTTSFFSGFPWNLWNNFNGAGRFNDIDYADVHKYIEADSTPFFDDAAGNTLAESAAYSAPMPIMRGELGWLFAPQPDLFNQNASDGLWLHNLIWAGMNAGGLIEHYWVGAPTQNHIYSSNHDHRHLFGAYYRFIKDIPLQLGGYIDAAPNVSNQNIRVVGQKNTSHNQAHLWIQNLNHTWRNIYNGHQPSPQSSTIEISGFSPHQDLLVEWWDTYSGQPSSSQTISTNSNGLLTLTVDHLTTDTAVRIGDYSHPTSPPSPADYIDYLQAINNFLSIFNINILIKSLFSSI
ncbi:MAG: hypothetical protein D6698_02360, partial [Gammaproteobacteria bacterium]